MNAGLPRPEKLRLLVADDDKVARLVVARSLARRFEVLEANDGAEAIDLFRRHRPDLVLLDVEMPVMTGVEAAEQMRAESADRFVPILLLSALDEVSTMVQGLRRGADDFLPKPFNLQVFDSKLAVFLRIRDVQQRLRDQNQELERYRANTESEHLLAKEFFSRIVARSASSDGRVRVSTSPMAGFDGDIALTARSASSAFRWLLADVAGHGLAGAVGTVPLSSMFFRMSKLERQLAAVVTATNEELFESLPARIFCAAVYCELDPARRRLSVINCGMPDAYVLRRGAPPLALSSQNVPLGIIGDLYPEVQTVDVTPGTRVLAVSDGVVEAGTSQGEMLGAKALLEMLAQCEPEEAFDAVLERVRTLSGEDQSDDVSVMEVVV